jgi:hypothetical protein|tara:strand:- start:6928 stop:7233 length:306 start_codon:yes stop_codon:yes gene_type:complete
MTKKGWRVTKHVQSICLKDVSFKVSEAGRQRVLKQKRKNVHALVEGEEIDQFNSSTSQVSYNPYISSNFFLKEDPNKKILKSYRAKVMTTGIEVEDYKLKN